MIQFYFHPTPNPAKVALFLEESGIQYEVWPVDTLKGEQHLPAFRAINPNGKVPAIVDTEGPNGQTVRVFDSTAILLYLGEKTGQFLGPDECRAEVLSWLMFVASGVGPFSGQAVHFQNSAEKIPYAINRYRREVERHYKVLDEHLTHRSFIVGDEYSVVDMSAWGWLDLAERTLPNSGDDALSAYPNLKRWLKLVDGRPAVARARMVGKHLEFKTSFDDESRKALFPSNYPAT